MKNKYEVDYGEDGELPYIEYPTVWKTIKDMKYKLFIVTTIVGFLCFALLKLGSS